MKTGLIKFALGTKFIIFGKDTIYIDDFNISNYPLSDIIEITKENQSEYPHYITRISKKYNKYESIDNSAFDKDLSYIDLSNFDFVRFTNLTGLYMSRSDLSNANFSGKDVSGSEFIRANLSHADLSYANLKGVNFGEANLCDANLTKHVSDGTMHLDRALYNSNTKGLSDEQKITMINVDNKSLRG